MDGVIRAAGNLSFGGFVALREKKVFFAQRHKGTKMLRFVSDGRSVPDFVIELRSVFGADDRRLLRLLPFVSLCLCASQSFSTTAHNLPTVPA
ncbi:hypothetical protein [Sphingomonas sp. CARO-RG-8B-R24-01]|uniref:hypothetical protein n=1 Tax=Sphingomonas sp. CARO-RG-8B-R24-01 TaxID=2914831 RepID=UPI001F5A48C5|nr:hypothetical protein [Sphingomonas sp. CARO-RG-8B-R24-01]